MTHGVRHRTKATRTLVAMGVTAAAAAALAGCSGSDAGDGSDGGAPASPESFEARGVAVVAPAAQWREQGADADAAAEVLANTGMEGLLTPDDYVAQVQAGCPDQPLPADEAGWVCDEVESTAYLVFPAALTTGDVASAAATEGADGDWQIHIELTEAGASKLTALTADAAERQPQGAVALVIEGDVLSSPVVTQPFAGGSLVLAGGWDEAEARAVANGVNSDA